MSDEWNSDTIRRKFAEERSHKDAGYSNENTRATGQAAILINGGAATAILAFLAKDKLDLNLMRVASLCLVLYAAGVSAGALMIFASARTLDLDSVYWRLRAHPEAGKELRDVSRRTNNWWVTSHWSFYASIGAFGVASMTIALALVLFTAAR
jgi:hypothetical protein